MGNLWGNLWEKAFLMECISQVQWDMAVGQTWSSREPETLVIFRVVSLKHPALGSQCYPHAVMDPDWPKVFPWPIGNSARRHAWILPVDYWLCIQPHQHREYILKDGDGSNMIKKIWFIDVHSVWCLGISGASLFTPINTKDFGNFSDRSDPKKTATRAGEISHIGEEWMEGLDCRRGSRWLKNGGFVAQRIWRIRSEFCSKENLDFDFRLCGGLISKIRQLMMLMAVPQVFFWESELHGDVCNEIIHGS